MPDAIRLIAERVRHFLANRRSAKRRTRRLRCTIGLTTSQAGVVSAHRDMTLDGYTFDFSSTGLSLLIPAVHIKGHYLTDAGASLLILIELEEGPILLHGTAVRYERLEDDIDSMKYLMGVRITEMSEHYRTRLVSLLK